MGGLGSIRGTIPIALDMDAMPTSIQFAGGNNGASSLTPEFSSPPPDFANMTGVGTSMFPEFSRGVPICTK